MLINRPLPGTDGQLRSGQGIGGRLQALPRCQVTGQQRLQPLELAPGVGKDGLLTLQCPQIAAVTNRLGRDLRLQIRHLGLGLVQQGRDILLRHRHQQRAGGNRVTFPHRPLGDPAGQAGHHRQLVRGHHFPIQGQHRGMPRQRQGLDPDPPAALGRLRVRRLRPGQSEQQEAGHASRENQQGEPSFRHRRHVRSCIHEGQGK